MHRIHSRRRAGFTLIELLTALVILSLLGLMSYRGLSAVLDTREHVKAESEKWRRVDAFFLRFARDVRLAAPRPVRVASGTAAAWLGRPATGSEPLLEFSRFASNEGVDTARRLGYRLNEKREIELWLWPGLDVAPATLPVRYAVLEDVKEFELQYLDFNTAWVSTWPVAPGDAQVPLAVRLRVLLGTGEELVRLFSLKS
jgi:general secretion pathway protein J